MTSTCRRQPSRGVECPDPPQRFSYTCVEPVYIRVYMSSTHVWKLRASEIGALLGRNKYKTTTQALADVFARHDRTMKTSRTSRCSSKKWPAALRSCGAAKDAIGSAVLTATRERPGRVRGCPLHYIIKNRMS